MPDSTTWQLNMIENAARRLRYSVDLMASRADSVASAGRGIGQVLASGGKILVAGNGGSAAGAQHFAAEFTGKLSVDRAPLPAVALSTDTSAITAISNDWTFDDVFARQVRAHGRPGDVFVGLTTSGTSENVRRAVVAAEEIGMVTVALTGPRNEVGGTYQVKVAVRETARVQEVHDLVLHEIVQIAERIAVEGLGFDRSADRFPFVLEAEDLPMFRAWIAESEQVLVTTNGVFDLLHEGHLSSLAQAKAHGDHLVALLNTDKSVRRIKGDSRPINSEQLRVADIRRAAYVDHVVLMDDDDPRALLDVLRPHVHCKGSDSGDRPMPERATVEAHGGRIEFLKLEAGLSTTALLERIEAR